MSAVGSQVRGREADEQDEYAPAAPLGQDARTHELCQKELAEETPQTRKVHLQVNVGVNCSRIELSSSRNKKGPSTGGSRRRAFALVFTRVLALVGRIDQAAEGS